ncbi:MAG TPA: sulfatase-like hydrolase/transferase [Candidatus Brocadiia bacterium]|nr:sulfatase-like hydrolase/transferase [Candidatus Brocadiia bacterium]
MAETRPNILLIFTDQQRWDTIRAAGNPVMRTPNLDRLAAGGTLFKSAYTPSPVCVSARCSLIFGQYPANTGCADNCDAMPDDRPTFMQSLTDAGYRTHGIGKMHFTRDTNALRGFQTRERQEELGGRVEDDVYLCFLRDNGFGHVYDPMGPRGEMYYIPQPSQLPARLHATNWVGDRSIEFLKNASLSQPFFLFSSFIHPHPPFSPPTPWNKLYRAPLMPLPKRPHQPESLHTYINKFQNRYKYRDNGIDNNLLRCIKAYYYACISFIDYQVGRMLDVLEQRGMAENTLILFTSDHGEMLGDYDCFGKRSMLDSAARIPMIARFRGRVPASATCDEPTSLVDILPTILNAAGMSEDAGRSDGVDLARVAAGEHSGRTIFSQFHRREHGVYMALNRRWKYFYSAPDRKEFLIDREQDPEETRNRAGIVFCAEALKEMRSRAIGFFRDRDVTEHIEGDSWKQYQQPRLPDDPDECLLIQDPGWSRKHQIIPGYTD